MMCVINDTFSYLNEILLSLFPLILPYFDSYKLPTLKVREVINPLICHPEALMQTNGPNSG